MLLIHDGASSHHGPEIESVLRENNIDVIVIPPHSSHISQALDVCVYHAMSSEFPESMVTMTNRLERNNLFIPSEAAKYIYLIVSSMIHAFDSIIRPQKCRDTFEKLGIFPPNMKYFFDFFLRTSKLRNP